MWSISGPCSIVVLFLVIGGTAGSRSSALRTFVPPFKGTVVTAHSTYDFGCNRSTERITMGPSLNASSGGASLSAKLNVRTCPLVFASGSVYIAVGLIGPSFRAVASGVYHATAVWNLSSSSTITTHWAAKGSHTSAQLVVRLQLYMVDVTNYTTATGTEFDPINVYQIDTNGTTAANFIGATHTVYDNRSLVGGDRYVFETYLIEGEYATAQFAGSAAIHSDLTGKLVSLAVN